MRCASAGKVSKGPNLYVELKLISIEYEGNEESILAKNYIYNTFSYGEYHVMATAGQA